MSFKQCITGVLLLASIVIQAGQAQDSLRTCSVTVYHGNEKRAELTVEIAETRKQRTYGLMFREKLVENTGMLFVYKSDKILNYWMKNVSIPLSIAYIDKNGIIRDIHHMKPHDDSTTYRSVVPVRYALEVNQGFFSEKNISIGDTVQLNGCIGK